MKHKLKGLLLTICMVITMIAFTTSVSASSMTEDEIMSYKQTASQLIEQIVSFTDEQIDQYLAMNDPFTTSALTSWSGVKEELGAFKSITNQDVVSENNVVTITSETEFEKATATIILELNLSQNALTSMDFSVNYAKSVLFGQAALNTVIGLGTVFVILFFLTFLISLFKHVPKLEQKLSGNESDALPGQAEEVQPAVLEEEELLNDDELVAVIAAAIAASENTSTDGFVVRSIRKSNRILRRA